MIELFLETLVRGNAAHLSLRALQKINDDKAAAAAALQAEQEAFKAARRAAQLEKERLACEARVEANRLYEEEQEQIRIRNERKDNRRRSHLIEANLQVQAAEVRGTRYLQLEEQSGRARSRRQRHRFAQEE